MNKISNVIFVLILLLVTSCSKKHKDESSKIEFYKNIEDIGCDIGIELKGSEYLITLDTIKISGEYELDTVKHVIVFHQTENNISGMIDESVITIQNYGNSMNPYTIFPSCDAKYIRLTKTK